MVSAAILGIGVVTLSQLYTSAARGVAERDSISEAVDIATQRAEEIATMDPEAVPACSGRTGCRAAPTSFTPELVAVGAYSCTRWVDAPSVDANPAGQARGTRYRVDMVVGAHPDPGRQAQAQLATVSVCWMDAGGAVHEVRLQRLLVPGA
jgi:hypothetical protein